MFNCELLSSEYKNNMTKLNIKCSCGKEFIKRWNKVSSDEFTSCHDCMMKRRRVKEKEEQWEIIYNYVDKTDCILISNKEDYLNDKSILRFICGCKNNFETSWASFYSGKHRCDKCGINIKKDKFIKTTDMYKKEVEAIDNNFEVLEPYNGSHCKIKHLYKPKNIIFEISPTNFLEGKRGYWKGSSKAEDYIYNYLTSKNIKFIHQHTFENLISIRKLKFDFAIIDANNKLLKLIEYDGEQHYFPVRFGGIDIIKSEENFKYLQNLDEMKNRYCRDNNIELIRIPYWDFDKIEKILEDIV